VNLENLLHAANGPKLYFGLPRSQPLFEREAKLNSCFRNTIECIRNPRRNGIGSAHYSQPPTPHPLQCNNPVLPTGSSSTLPVKGPSEVGEAWWKAPQMHLDASYVRIANVHRSTRRHTQWGGQCVGQAALGSSPGAVPENLRHLIGTSWGR
jgi:hypothetical protein